jgi:RNA polymerase sigma factor (sigma-70 family)
VNAVVGETTMPAEDDSTIVAESLSRPEVFARLFDRHFATVHRYLARRVGVSDAEDLAAEVFLQAFRRRETYDLSRADARPWLLGVATNVARRHHRTESRALRLLARTGVDPAMEDHAERVVGRVAAEAWYRSIAAVLAEMSAGDRDVLLLFAWEGLSYDEVAEALDVPPGTVRSRLHRARKQIRDTLGDMRGSHPGGPDG